MSVCVKVENYEKKSQFSAEDKKTQDKCSIWFESNGNKGKHFNSPETQTNTLHASISHSNM